MTQLCPRVLSKDGVFTEAEDQMHQGNGEQDNIGEQADGGGVFGSSLADAEDDGSSQDGRHGK